MTHSFLDNGSIFDVSDCPQGYYAEWVPVFSEEDKKDAYEYLRLWKKFLLLKLHYLQQEGEDQYIAAKPTIGLKIKLVKK